MRTTIGAIAFGCVLLNAAPAEAEVVSLAGTVTSFQDPTGGAPGIPDLTGSPMTIMFDLIEVNDGCQVKAVTPLVVGDYSFTSSYSDWGCGRPGNGGYYLGLPPFVFVHITGPGVDVTYDAVADVSIKVDGSVTWRMSLGFPDPVGNIDGTARVTNQPLSLDFGQVVVGGAKWLTLVVTNNEDTNLVVYSIGSSFPISPPFFVASDGCTGSTLVPGASCEISVGFTPATAGEYRDTFSIEFSDPYAAGSRVNVSGFAAILGGQVTGMDASDVTCENKTQKIKLQFPLADVEAGLWDCQAAGLPVQSGDEVTMKVKGVAQ